MIENCEVIACGKPATKVLAYMLRVQAMRLPAMAHVCDKCGLHAKEVRKWHTAPGDGPTLSFPKFLGKNSTFLSLDDLD